MRRRKIWRHILIGSAWAIGLGGLVMLMSFVGIKRSEVICKDVKIYIPGDQYFIDKQEVEKILDIQSHALVGKRMEVIDIHDLEKKLQANPFVESARVYSDMDGIINVEISQRRPILRMINLYDQDFYVDQHGVKIPLSGNFTARVLVATGYIDEAFANQVDTLHTPIAMQLYKTADFISRDSLWGAQIAQLYVNKDHDIELIPRVGNNRILLGDADSLDVKFRNLLVFYKKAIPQVGWDAYKVINLKYANQVIGVRSENIKKDSLAAKQAVADSLLTARKDTSQITD